MSTPRKSRFPAKNRRIDSKKKSPLVKEITDKLPLIWFASVAFTFMMAAKKNEIDREQRKKAAAAAKRKKNRK